MGKRRYAKSGLGFLLAFALMTSAAPAVAGPAEESDAGQQGDAVQRAGTQQEAARSVAGAATTEPAKMGATPAPAAESSTATGSTAPAGPTPPVEEAVKTETAPSPRPMTTSAGTGQLANPAPGQPAAPSAERSSGPVEAPTQAGLPTSSAEETAEPAPGPEDVAADPVAAKPSEITVKVYKMVTGLDGGTEGAVPKSGWTFSLDGRSIKNANRSATTNGNGLAVFSGEAPGNSGKANVTISESGASMSDYELVQQHGQNAVCRAGGEAIDIKNAGETGFRIKVVGGEPVTCTVYSKPLAAELTLVNEVKNGTAGTASPSGWKLTATPGTTSSDAVTATGTADGHTFEVAHGTYELSQSTGPGNYTWLSLACSTDGGPAVNIEDFSITLDAGTDTTCTFTNAYQGIDIDKQAWDTADVGSGYPAALLEFGDGALVPFGATVTWTYTVTNTGGSVVNGITVDDDKLAAAVTCPESALEPGASMICTAAGQLTG
ncbi:DUF7507 domain-containing protein [Arthrobacter castelli]|uniref:DUF7507 domain-containing protein n=1 Tax=Arthrobacter castelli TaxID=271431 RepID=UPI0003F822CB|nr:hypothetical protein [Arthrobacter castelli]